MMISFFATTVVIASLVPHFIKGSMVAGFSIPEDYEQSAIILTESFLGLIFYRFYRRRVYSLLSEKEKIEKSLKNTYAHIGKINNKIELLKNFITMYPANGLNKLSEKNSYEKLLSYMIVSVAKASEGFIRFVDIQSGKTLKEFSYNYGNKNSSNSIKLSNSLVASGEIDQATGKSIEIVESYYHESPIKCVLCFPRKEENFDRSLLQLLLTHIHLMFLASRSCVPAYR